MPSARGGAGAPWGCAPQTPIGPEGASSSNAGRAESHRPALKSHRTPTGEPATLHARRGRTSKARVSEEIRALAERVRS